MPVPFISKMISQHGENLFLKRITSKVINIKSSKIIKRIDKYILGSKILDVGTGIGGIYHNLSVLGYKVTGLDVHNVSAFKSVVPIIYDGMKFPFKDQAFDTAIIIHVLHHCNDGKMVLKEAMRTAKRVILIEDTFRNKFEHQIVSMNDAIGNWEFYQHPYYKSEEWKAFFPKNELENYV